MKFDITKHTDQLILIFALIGFSIVLSISLQSILPGKIPFWYDPARDLLLGLENLRKPTLIGPPAGIPGIFYGPYWIWLLSFGLLFSKDPRTVSIIVLLIPYFTLFPFIMWKIGKQWGMLTAATLGILFLLTFNEYTKQLWNPHLAPLLFLAVVYILASSDFIQTRRNDLLKVLSGGFVAGLLVNFHISFGIGVMAGIVLFFLVDLIRLLIQKKKKLKIPKLLKHYGLSVVVFYTGVAIAFLPFLLFESRHGFNQTQAAVKTLLNPFATVGVWGLTDELIITHFFKPIFKLTEFNYTALLLVAVILIGNILYLFYKKKKLALSAFTIKIILLLLLTSVAVFYFYLNSKNPVWEYHFIGVEILFLLSLGVLMSTFQVFRYFVTVWLLYLLILQVPIMASEAKKSPVDDTLIAKEVVVKSVVASAEGNNYEVLVYNPAIYTYDFDYLFLQLEGKKVTKNLSELKGFSGPVYLVIPGKDKAKTEDYINAQTRGVSYKKEKEWNATRNTRIIKLSDIK